MSGPFGVELPDSFGESQEGSGTEISEKHSEGSDTSTDTQDLTKETKPETPQDLLDLDKLDRFRFNGKEVTRKDLDEWQKSGLRQADYTKKTQELAETRKYADNFAIDVGKVIQNPKLWDEFRKVYPKEYVSAAQNVLNRTSGQPPATTPSQTQQTPARDPELDEIKSDLAAWKEEKYRAEVDGHTKWLETQYSTLSSKYPYANKAEVTNWAQHLVEQKTEITESVLDKLFNQSNGSEKSRFDEMYKAKVDKQINQGKKAKDIASGGGIPSAAPSGAKTMKDAKREMLKHFGAE